jgi:hypothetical protein
LLIDSTTIKYPITEDFKVGLSLVNNSDSVFTFGPAYSIEWLNNGKWRQPKPRSGAASTHYGFETPLLSIGPHSKKGAWMFFFTRIHFYQPGKYRVKKQVRNWETKQEKTLYAEFEIKK